MSLHFLRFLCFTPNAYHQQVGYLSRLKSSKSLRFNRDSHLTSFTSKCVRLLESCKLRSYATLAMRFARKVAGKKHASTFGISKALKGIQSKE